MPLAGLALSYQPQLPITQLSIENLVQRTLLNHKLCHNAVIATTTSSAPSGAVEWVTEITR